MSFLSKEGVICAILKAGSDQIKIETERYKIPLGAGCVGIVLDGKVHTDIIPLNRNFKLSINDKTPIVGEMSVDIDYLEQAMKKMANSVRVGKTLPYPPASHGGACVDLSANCCEIFRDLDRSEYQFHTVYASDNYQSNHNICACAIEAMRVKARELEKEAEKLAAQLNRPQATRTPNPKGYPTHI